MKYRPDSFYTANKCKTLFGRTVAAIDSETKKSYWKTGKKFPMTGFFGCDGSRPFIPPMEGVDTVDAKFTFYVAG